MLRLSGSKALLFLQLLIAVITRSAVNVRAISKGFVLVSLVTIQVSLEKVCLSSFEVLHCLLILIASCLDDENEHSLKVITSFSVPRFALSSIPLIVLHSLAWYVSWFMVSKQFIHYFLFVHADTVLDVFIPS